MVAPGETFGHYTILAPLGKGGMGEVFLARDELLDRKVALKFVSGAIEHDPSARERFPREAKAAAQLDHPFVCKVYEAGEKEDHSFIAMEYVEGVTLAERLRSGPLDLDEACQIALEVAEALEVAHAHGIAHRDLKPANVMLTSRHAKVMDFGLAKFVPMEGAEATEASTLSGQKLTQSGIAVGTLAYMSPEQAQGKAVDTRTDVFSFGVMVHEMLSGEHPFRRSSAFETASAILRDDPPAIRLTAGRTPAALEAILRRALAKKPEDRYQSGRQLADDLRRLRQTMASGEGRRRWRIVGAAVAVAALVGATWWLAVHRSGAGPAVATPPPRSVLVADFENATGEPVFDGVLEQAVSIGLEGASFIHAFSRPRAREVAAEIRPGTPALDLETARLVARREGIAFVVSGGIKRAGPGYRVEVTALDGVSGARLATHAQEVPEKGRVLAAIGEIVVLIRRDMGDAIPDSVRAAANETFTAGSLEAARSYAQAQELMAAGKWREAVPIYENALQLDPAFGRAYAGLAVCHLNLNQTEEARKYYEKAFSLIDRMTDREKYRTRGGYYLLVRNYAKATEEYRALAENFPSDPAGPTNLAFAYFYARDMRHALETGRLAVEARPDAALPRANLALYAMYAGDFATAAREADTVLAANPGYETAYVAAAMARLDAGDGEGARGFYRRLQGLGPHGVSLAATGLADLALFHGRTQEAIDLLERGIAGDMATGLEADAARKHSMLAAAFLSRADVRHAVVAAERALALSKRHYILLCAGRTLAAAGEEKRARQLAAALASQIEPEPRSFAKLVEGEVLLHRGEAREAAARFRESDEILDTWLGRYLLGRAYLEAGAFTEAYSELEIALKRRGEATAIFLDDVPSYFYFPPVYYYLGRAQEGLGSAGAIESYRRFVSLKATAEDDPLVLDARQRLRRR
jgi:tetratricopeptide (TPR) repeat protein/predicted Ser/Thr protein kinase/TolB-like protein